jgi:hypothetical protein
MFGKFKEWKSQKAWWINRFTLTLFGFLLWMSCFDRHNIFAQWYLISTVDRMEAEKQSYLDGIEETKRLKIEIDEDIEKFAREQYYMHRPDEEVFVFK